MAFGGIAMIAIMGLFRAPSPSSAAAEEPSSLTAVQVEPMRPGSKGRIVPAHLVGELRPSSPELKGAAALQLIDYPWEDLGYELAFLPAVEGLRGLTYPYEQRIEIYVRPNDTPESLAHVVAHEIGHVVDVVLNSGERRVRWLEARGLAADYRWWPASGQSDFATGAGDFAECFAVWQVDAPSYSEINADCSNDLELLESLAVPDPLPVP